MTIKKYVRGIRDSAPQGYMLARVSKGKGPLELVKTPPGFLTPNGVVIPSGSITITLVGDVTGSSVSPVTTTIANDAVSNAKLANMAAWTVKIRNTGSSGDPSDAALADWTTATPAGTDFLMGFLSTGELRKFSASGLGKIYAPLTTGVLVGGTDPEFVVTAAGECIMAEIS